MTNVATSITDLIGKTPMVQLNSLTQELNSRILLKLEMFNPLSSVKDRIALNMIVDAETHHRITANTTIVEPTSGNTGVGLAFVCASKGYKLILTMPDTMSVERRKLLKALGAQLVLTPGSKGMKGAIEEAQQLVKKNPDHFLLGQFSNPANPQIHFETTGPEIWRDTDGQVDIFVAGVGTGGTITGVSRYIKKQNQNFKAIAVEPKNSAVLSGSPPGPHKIQGIGAGFIPDNLETQYISEVITVTHEDAGDTARKLAKKEGILGGISTGANLFAALQVASRKENEGKTIVTLAPDTGERYLSTWLFEE